MKLLKETQNSSVIKAVKKIFQSEKKNWWDDFSLDQKEAIEEGLRDAEEGRVVPFKDFMDHTIQDEKTC